jgi:hypothetical protein
MRRFSIQFGDLGFQIEVKCAEKKEKGISRPLGFSWREKTCYSYFGLLFGLSSSFGLGRWSCLIGNWDGIIFPTSF